MSGNGGTSVTDEVTAVAKDSDDNSATDKDTASVSITNSAPALTVTKTPSVSSIAEPGGPIGYTVKITNSGTETLTLDSIKDSIEGGSAIDVTAVAPPVTATTCAPLIGSTLAPGGQQELHLHRHERRRQGDLSDGDLDDTVTVKGHDDDGNATGHGHR